MINKQNETVNEKTDAKLRYLSQKHDRSGHIMCTAPCKY